jgi:hypothetical protein
MRTAPTIFAIADSLGITITQRLAHSLSHETDSLLTTLLELANRIRRHRSSTLFKITDLKRSLESRGHPPLIGYHSTYRTYEYHPIPGLTQPLHGLSERDIPISAATRTVCPQYPFDLTFHFHWLAIGGVQPHVPENLSQFFFFFFLQLFFLLLFMI